MGIDFGTKRIGVAISDETNSFALPHVVLATTKNIYTELNTIICDNDIGYIILGESQDYHMNDNPVMKEIRKFKQELENRFAKPVIFEPEMMTSREAEHIQGKNEMHDASAAALILKSYLDRIKTE